MPARTITSVSFATLDGRLDLFELSPTVRSVVLQCDIPNIIALGDWQASCDDEKRRAADTILVQYLPSISRALRLVARYYHLDVTPSSS